MCYTEREYEKNAGGGVMTELNCLGDLCPVPLMKLMQCAELQSGGTVKLVTDHSCVHENIVNYCKKRRLELRVEEPVNGVWELFVSK